MLKIPITKPTNNNFVRYIEEETFNIFRNFDKCRSQYSDDIYKMKNRHKLKKKF